MYTYSDTMVVVSNAAYDGNGNILTLVNSSDGSTVASYEYSPFGECIKAQGSLALENKFRFSTKYSDDEIGLIYYGYRYYDAKNGRWVSRDPIGERGGLNIYVLLENGAVNWIDALGLLDCSRLQNTITKFDEMNRAMIKEMSYFNVDYFGKSEELAAWQVLANAGMAAAGSAKTVVELVKVGGSKFFRGTVKEIVQTGSDGANFGAVVLESADQVVNAGSDAILQQTAGLTPIQQTLLRTEAINIVGNAATQKAALLGAGRVLTTGALIVVGQSGTLASEQVLKMGQDLSSNTHELIKHFQEIQSELMKLYGKCCH